MTFPFDVMETKERLLGMRLLFWKCFETGEIMQTADSVVNEFLLRPATFVTLTSFTHHLN